MEFYVTAAPGTERVLVDELRDLGFRSARGESGSGFPGSHSLHIIADAGKLEEEPGNEQNDYRDGDLQAV